MNLAVYGASGRTGSLLACGALRRGWSVQALMRPNAEVQPQAGLQIICGDPSSADDVADVLRSCDAACCVFGPRPPYISAFCADFTGAVVQGMMAHQVSRIICLTGAMIGALPRNISLPMRLMAAAFRHSRPAVAADRAAQEEIIENSGLLWTIVKPPRLVDGSPVGRIHAGTDLRMGLRSRISRSDLAEFLLEVLSAGRYLRQRVYVKR